VNSLFNTKRQSCPTSKSISGALFSVHDDSTCNQASAQQLIMIHQLNTCIPNYLMLNTFKKHTCSSNGIVEEVYNSTDCTNKLIKTTTIFNNGCNTGSNLPATSIKLVNCSYTYTENVVSGSNKSKYIGILLLILLINVLL
jgi:hypothetical protein